MLKEHDEKLFASIINRGIEIPLNGISLEDGSNLLLDGFKRYRIAVVAGLSNIPFISLSSNESEGIFSYLNSTFGTKLNILEHGAFIDHLHNTSNYSISDIAARLKKSKGWVGMRNNIIKEISGKIREKIFNGEFPGYAYIYHVRPFMRMNGVGFSDVEQFICAVSGKKLSTREIKRLAHGYFCGPKDFRNSVDNGDIAWALNCSRGLFNRRDFDCNSSELVVLQDLERVINILKRLALNIDSTGLQNQAFFARAELLAESYIQQQSIFESMIRGLYDRSRDAASDKIDEHRGGKNQKNEHADALVS